MKIEQKRTDFEPVIVTLETLDEVLYLNGLTGNQTKNDTEEHLTDACYRYEVPKPSLSESAVRINDALFSALEKILTEELK
jgi:hypothetical protein